MLELAVTPGRPHLPPSIIFDQPDYLSNLQRIRFYAPGIPSPTLSQADTSDARRLAASGDGGEADPLFGDGRFASRVRGTSEFSVVEQDRELAHDFCAGIGRQTRRELRVPSAPIEALHLISQDDAAHRQAFRNHNLERIALRLARDRTEEA